MITHPTLLLDKDKCLANIQRMIEKAKQSNTLLRPHFKTHQSAEVGEYFKDFEVNCCTVSSVKMAGYFAQNGWTDITVAFPVNLLEWSALDQLASKINLNIVVENQEAIHYLEKQLSNPVGVYIKTDTGYGRTGIDAENYKLFQQLLTQLKTCKKLIFIGFLCHAGHTYSAASVTEINHILNESRQKLLALKTFMAGDFPLIQLSYGDTPSCSIGDDFSDFDEIRPGNFVFYDEMQTRLGSCQRSDIAVSLICPVVAKHPERNEVVVHGGAVHLSKDSVLDANGKPYYGIAVAFNGTTWNSEDVIGHVSKVSQEHGIITPHNNRIETIQTGDLIAILPIHSCLTANLMKSYQLTSGETLKMLL